MKRRTFAPALAVVLALALADRARAEDRLDLSGAWTTRVPEGDAAPGTGVFYAKKPGKKSDGYSLRLTARVEGSLRSFDFIGTFDGKTLTLYYGKQTASGHLLGLASSLNQLFGDSGAARAEEAGKGTFGSPIVYELDGDSKFERLKIVSTVSGDASAPAGELRRPREPDVRCPAEFEPAEEILWSYKDAFAVSRIYQGAIKGTFANGESALHRIFVSTKADQDELDYEFGEAKVPLAHVQFASYKFGSIWMRDFGPIMLQSKADGKKIVGDMAYFPERKRDDGLPKAYASLRGFELRDVTSLHAEGGNFISDGKGRIFMSTRALEANGSQIGVEASLAQLGAREVVFMERMPEPEGTGHIDMYAKLSDAKTVFVGSCDDEPEFRAVLERNAAKFRALGYKLVRLPMANGKKLMTYTNSLFVGKTVLVPTYKSERDQPALDAYASQGWKPVGIDSRVIIPANGAIHCVSMQIPR